MEQEDSGSGSGSGGRFRRKPRPFVSDEAAALRVPPHSLEAEQAVLGGLLLDNSTWDSIADRLRAEDFYRRDHQLIFEAIARPVAERRAERRRHARGAPRQQGAGRRDRRPRLPRGPRARHAHRREHPRLRRHRPRALAAAAADPRQRRDRRQRLRERRQAGRRTGRRGRAPHLPDRREGPEARAPASCRCAKCSGATIDRLDMLHASQGQLTGLSTGYAELDKMTAGLQPGDLVIVAGRPSMGKTTFALNIAENAAIAAQQAGRDLLDGNVARAARVPHDLVARPRRPGPHAHRQLRRRGLGAHQQRDRADEDGADLHRRQRLAHADRSARPRAPPRARLREAGRPRPDRHRLPAADAGGGQQGKPRDRDLRDLALAQGAGEGTAACR